MIASESYKNKIKLLALFCFLVFLASLWSGVHKHIADNYKHTLIWDAEGYYLYLPAIFINHGFENLEIQTFADGQKVYKPYPGTDKIFTKYTYGVALMESPFFLLAHLYCKLTDATSKPGSYYMGPYMLAIIFADTFYLTLGLFILGLLLLRISPLSITMTTLLIIWLGTNLLYYSSYAIGASHVISFFLISIFIFITPMIYDQWAIKHIILSAMVMGLIILIRPTNIVIGLYLVFFDIYSIADLKKRISLYLKKWFYLLLFPLFIFIFFLPQFAYWNYISGHYILYSYQEEGFIFWKNPRVFSVLFSPLNGFFLFAPLMLLSMVGLICCFKQKAMSCWAVLAIFCITDYICGSWWYWNFGVSYGFRPYIDFLPVLSLPMAFLLCKTTKWRLPAKSILIISLMFFIFLSIRLQKAYTYTWQGYGWGWKDIGRIYLNAIFIKS